jgi:DNA (cytosine-5)-methyltransferase 1
MDLLGGKINGLDLFSGISGLSVALAPWVRPIAYCENEPYAQSVLLSRMYSGQIELAPIWDDVRSLRGSHFGTRSIDIIYGGFPCQDLSLAGLGKGLEGERSGLFFEIVRLAKEVQPTFIFLENVPGLRTRGFSRVIQELSAAGYVGRGISLSAAEVGAPHKRERVFILAAHPERLKLWDEQGRGSGTSGESSAQPRLNGSAQSVAHASSGGNVGSQEQTGESFFSLRGNAAGVGAEELADTESVGLEGLREGLFGLSSETWTTEPDVGRVAHGVLARVDRLRALGNAVVPLQAREAFERLMGLKNY